MPGEGAAGRIRKRRRPASAAGRTIRRAQFARRCVCCGRRGARHVWHVASNVSAVVICRRVSIVGCVLAAYAAMGARRAKADALTFGPEMAVDEPVLSPVLATRSPKVAFNGT